MRFDLYFLRRVSLEDEVNRNTDLDCQGHGDQQRLAPVDGVGLSSLTRLIFPDSITNEAWQLCEGFLSPRTPIGPKSHHAQVTECQPRGTVLKAPSGAPWE